MLNRILTIYLCIHQPHQPTMALVSAKGLLDQSVAKGVGKSAKGRWCEYKKHTFMSSASLVLVRLVIHKEFWWESQRKLYSSNSRILDRNISPHHCPHAPWQI